MQTKSLLKLTLPSALLLFAGCSIQPCPRPPAGKPAAEEPTAAPAAQPLGFLHAEGSRLVNEQGEPVQLHGCNVGGWLLLEPWINGMDNQANAETEKELWDLLGNRFGEQAKQDLIKTYRDNFFKETDVQRIAKLGFNCIRLPVWWRTTDDPAYGADIGYLDRCIQWCARNGVYVIIDLQGAPGGQAKESANVGEPSEGGALWRNPAYKDQAVDWWKRMAARYKDEPAVAAYDVLNEGTAPPRYEDLVDLYDRLYKEIRAIDARHILVFEDVWGFHRLPSAEDWGWENVVYSFHYYPRDLQIEQAIEAPDADLPKYNRTALSRGLPIYVGEFSTFDQRHGGTDAVLKYREVFDYFGWSWTFWTYNKIEENDYVLWGIYGYGKGRPRPDLNSDPLEKIKRDFELFAAENSSPHPLLPSALTAPIRWEPDPDFGPGSITLSLRNAFVLTSEKGYLRYEWGMSPPNLGYWTAGDTAGWRIKVEASGVYEFGLNMANNSDKNLLQLWVDGVHAGNLPMPNTGGWRKYGEASLGRLELAAGPHILEIGQADGENGFINLRGGWLKPAEGEPLAADETAVWLKPLNMEPLRPKTPIRVEWLNNPPNIGNWSPGEQASWKIRLKKGGAYAVRASYSTPNADTTLKVLVDGQPAAQKALASTGDWQKYSLEDIGAVTLSAGEHTIVAQWDVPRPTAPGNLRELQFQIVPAQP
ncbi:MAG: cellulase family glycosylhydrolase [Verrucomicrobiota bacterium]